LRTGRRVPKSDPRDRARIPATSDQIEKMRAVLASQETSIHTGGIGFGEDAAFCIRKIVTAISHGELAQGYAGRLQVSPMVCSAMWGAEPFTAFASRSYGSSGRS
jgi:hypothetical protein